MDNISSEQVQKIYADMSITERLTGVVRAAAVTQINRNLKGCVTCENIRIREN